MIDTLTPRELLEGLRWMLAFYRDQCVPREEVLRLVDAVFPVAIPLPLAVVLPDSPSADQA